MVAALFVVSYRTGLSRATLLLLFVSEDARAEIVVAVPSYRRPKVSKLFRRGAVNVAA